MLIGLFNGLTMRATRAALTGLAQRHDAISSNIANIDTVGYRRRAVTFEGALRDSVAREQGHTPLRTTHPQHISAGGGGAYAPGAVDTRDVIAQRNDSNAVSIDEEMAQLAETQLRYQALTQTLSRRLSTLRSAIRGG